MLSGISIGTSMFLLTIIVCITMPKNGQVEGSPLALATANAKELAGASLAASGWEIWFWDPWGNWVWFEVTLTFASRGQALKAKEAEVKNDLKSRNSCSRKGQTKRSQRC